jgi:hypothetical protein
VAGEEADERAEAEVAEQEEREACAVWSATGEYMRVSGAPVRIDESAYAASVVAMISSSRPSPISAATRFAMM